MKYCILVYAAVLLEFLPLHLESLAKVFFGTRVEPRLEVKTFV